MKDSLTPFADAALGAMPYLTLMPLLLPALAAGLIFLVPKTWAQRTITLVTLFALAVIATVFVGKKMPVHQGATA